MRFAVGLRLIQGECVEGMDDREQKKARFAPGFEPLDRK
jgi:hypothetical protein